MEEQDNSEILQALGLLANEETSKKRRLPDYKILQFFDYEQCFSYFAKRIMNIRQAKIHGEVIVAKPVLILSLIDGIGENVFTDNEFHLNDWLEERYLMLMKQYTRSSQFSKITGIENPFWHLSSDGFWNLQCRQSRKLESSPSKAWLRDYVEYAYLDESLWVLLQNKVWRMKMRNYIIEHKLTDDSWGNLKAAEGLCVLTAILLVA